MREGRFPAPLPGSASSLVGDGQVARLAMARTAYVRVVAREGDLPRDACARGDQVGLVVRRDSAVGQRGRVGQALVVLLTRNLVACRTGPSRVKLDREGAVQ